MGESKMALKGHHFKTGNICRIYIKNFLTLREIEIRPKPKLNLIYGANGSGKSTILCAICICLGGRPAVTGRGKVIYDYVKRGQTEAILEVEIYVEGQINAVVRLKINSLLKSCLWYLQGKEVTHEKVMKRIRKLNIEMDNLCQFLPQDRVVEFANLNNVSLLKATQEAVGDPSLHKDHQALCDSSSELVTLQERQKELEEKLAEAERRNARLKTAVDNMEVKEKLQKEVDTLQTQRSWCLYDHKRKEHAKHKESLKEMQSELEAVRKKFEPTLSKIAERKAQLHTLKKLIKEKDTQQQRMNSAISESYEAFQRHQDQLREARRNFLEKQTEEQQQKIELADYKKQLDVLEGQLQHLPQLNEEETAHRLRRLTTNIQRSSGTIVALQGRMTEAVTEKDASIRRLSNTQKQLDENQDILSQRMKLLKEKNSEAYHAAIWVNNNQHRFQAPIHPPVFTKLDIVNQSFAPYVESRVMLRDLVAFVCENKDDVNHLKEEMDRQKLRINIIYSDPNELQQFRPKHPIGKLRHLGFTAYMLDVINAPAAVLAFLCRAYAVHTVPIALNKGNYTQVPQDIAVFYMGNNRYSLTRSRYDGEVSTSIYPLRPAQLLHITLNQERIDQLSTTKERLRTEIQEMDVAIQNMQAQEEELTKKLEEWRNEKRSLSSRKEERRQLLHRIKLKVDQIERHKANTIDLEAERAEMERRCAESIRLQVEATVRNKASLEAIKKGIFEGLKAEGKVKLLVKILGRMEASVEEQRMTLAELEKETKKLKEEVEEHKEAAQVALKALLWKLGVKSASHITMEIRSKFADASLEETEKLLAEKDAHLACLVTATANELLEYQGRQKKMEGLRKQLQEAQSRQENYDTAFSEIKERWLPRITQLVENISAQFSAFMARLNYAGEVKLRADGDNFRDYGMEIMVKFRHQQKLQALTPHQQSGGERALSTALYLLALQSLTMVPFRCVDEINQGMDPVNERQFLQMLIETEGSEGSSQYFFVSPKIMPSLEYKKHNVTVVMNSQHTMPHGENNIKKILRLKAEKNRRGVVAY